VSTDDVPGHKPENNDKLALGCWAEHQDGSLVHVDSVEGDRVVYSIFDVSKVPPVQWRGAMPEKGFKNQFSWPNSSKIRWTWHDKTPFPWDRVMSTFDEGQVQDANIITTAARRVAERLGLGGAKPVDKSEAENFRETVVEARTMIDRLQTIISKLDA
jgi:hypothetical protein